MENTKKAQELYLELQKWKSYIYFIDDEQLFMDRLLNSYIFEPSTPNLFERLELFKQKFAISKKKKQNLKKVFAEHEGKLGGILECTSAYCDATYNKKHKKFLQKVTAYVEDYIKLKSEVYEYAGSILKKRKPP